MISIQRSKLCASPKFRHKRIEILAVFVSAARRAALRTFQGPVCLLTLNQLASLLRGCDPEHCGTSCKNPSHCAPWAVYPEEWSGQGDSNTQGG